MPQIFLSYASDDNDFAELTKLKLKEKNINVWIDQSNLRPGDDWKEVIDDGINTSDLILVVLSPASFRSTYVTYEWAFAMGKGKKIIPLLLKPGETHPKLSELQYLDFTSKKSRPWHQLIEEIYLYSGEEPKVDEQPVSEQDNLNNYEIAKDQILSYLERTGFNMVSFERIRKNIDPKYSDDFLMNVIRTNHKDLRRAILSGQKQGVAKQ